MRLFLVALLAAVSLAQTGYDDLFLDLYSDTTCGTKFPLYGENWPEDQPLHKIASLTYGKCQQAIVPFPPYFVFLNATKSEEGEVTLKWFGELSGDAYGYYGYDEYTEEEWCSNPIDVSAVQMLREDIVGCEVISTDNHFGAAIGSARLFIESYPARVRAEQYTDDQCTTLDDNALLTVVFGGFTVGECMRYQDGLSPGFFKVGCTKKRSFEDEPSLTFTMFVDPLCTTQALPIIPMDECLADLGDVIFGFDGEADCMCKAQENSKWSDTKCRNRCETGVRETINENRCEKHCTNCADIEMTDDTCVSISDWSKHRCRKRCHFPDTHPERPWGHCDDKCAGCKLNSPETRRSLNFDSFSFFQKFGQK